MKANLDFLLVLAFCCLGGMMVGIMVGVLVKAFVLKKPTQVPSPPPVPEERLLPTWATPVESPPVLPRRPWILSKQYEMTFVLSQDNEILIGADACKYLGDETLRYIVRAVNEHNGGELFMVEDQRGEER